MARASFRTTTGSLQRRSVWGSSTATGNPNSRGADRPPPADDGPRSPAARPPVTGRPAPTPARGPRHHRTARRASLQAPVWWLIDGDSWIPKLVAALEQCLARTTYFGRAESLTRVRLAGSQELVPAPNCTLVETRTVGRSDSDTTGQRERRAHISADHAGSRCRVVPPGTPTQEATAPAAGEKEGARRSSTAAIQFAWGGGVAGPGSRGEEPGAATYARRYLPVPLPLRRRPRARGPRRRRMPARGRLPPGLVRAGGMSRPITPSALLRRGPGAVIHRFCGQTGILATWTRVERSCRVDRLDMVGKDANDQPLKGHHHTEFFAWCEAGEPTRLVAWRGPRAFDADEQRAILLAASRDVSCAAAGSDGDGWKVRLVPLDRDVPAPPGFDTSSSVAWESVSPYVPPRHHLRGGKEREGESMAEQIQRELPAVRHRRAGQRSSLLVLLRGCQSMFCPGETAVPRGGMRTSTSPVTAGGGKQPVRLLFAAPVAGPIRLGHSSSFGLGLFRPVQK